MAMRRAEPKRKARPATTPEARENQLIGLAVDLAEKQIREGTASSQVITHFLKLATVRESLEQDKIRKENALLTAKVDTLASQRRTEEVYTKALRAMRAYAGNDVEDDEYYDET